VILPETSSASSSSPRSRVNSLPLEVGVLA
jgi:hypothetical protein